MNVGVINEGSIGINASEWNDYDKLQEHIKNEESEMAWDLHLDPQIEQTIDELDFDWELYDETHPRGIIYEDGNKKGQLKGVKYKEMWDWAPLNYDEAMGVQETRNQNTFDAEVREIRESESRNEILEILRLPN